MDAQPPHDDLDPATAEALEQGYASRVGLDTAARHLWVLYRFAGMGEAGEDPAGDAERSPTSPRTLRPNVSAGDAGVDEPHQTAETAQPAPAPASAPEPAPAAAEPASEGRQRTRQLAVSLLTGAALLITSGGAVAASGSALPGDALYPLKRGTEQVRLVLATRSGADAHLHLAMARKRWAEAKRAAPDRPDVVAGLVHDAIDALEVAERGQGDVAHEAGSFRSELLEERATIASAVDTPQRSDVRSSFDRLAASDGTDVAGPAGGQTDATASEPGDRADGSSTATPIPGTPHEAPPASEKRERPSEPASPGEPSDEEPGHPDDDAETRDESRVEGEDAGDEEHADDDGLSAVEEGGDAAENGLAAGGDTAGEGLDAVEGTPAPNEDEGGDGSEAAPQAGGDSDTSARGDADEAAPPPQHTEGGESPTRSSPTLSPDPTQQHIRY